jgi:hypothetical protein
MPTPASSAFIRDAQYPIYPRDTVFAPRAFKEVLNSDKNNSLHARIDELLKQISVFLVRIAELDARAGGPP